LQDYVSSACTDSAGNICFNGLVEVKSTDLSNDTRYHVVVTMDSTQTSIYLNGTLKGTGGVFNPDFRSIRIGTRYTNDTSRFHGQIDDVRLYNRALSATEVAQLWTITNNVQGGDCNDASIRTHPLASEVCDLADNDCDASVDEGVSSTYYLDADADGYSTGATTSRCHASSVGLKGYRSFDASTGTDDSGNGNTGSVLNGVTFS